MAILRPVLGPITQSFSNLTTSKWKNKTVLKAKVPARNTSNSPAQAAQRRRFALLAGLAGTWGPALRMGFVQDATDMTEQNVFVNKNYEFTSDNGTVASIDYTKLIVSSGIVGGVAGLDAELNSTTGSIAVTWSDNSNGSNALPTDRLNLLIVNTVTGYTQVETNVRTRDDSPVTASNPAFIGAIPANIRVYAFFKRATSRATSPSTSVVAHA